MIELAQASLVLVLLFLVSEAGVRLLHIDDIASRHRLLLLVCVLALCLPGITRLLSGNSGVEVVVPRWVPVPDFVGVTDGPVEENIGATAPAVEGAAAAAPRASQQRPLVTALQALYGGVAALLAMRFAAGVLLAFRLRRRASPVSGEELEARWSGASAMRVFESQEVGTPVTLGLRRPVVLLPLAWREWDDMTVRAVLTHESTHAARGDFATGLLCEAVAIIYWFHPIAWLLARRGRLLAEHVADREAARAVGDPRRYAQLLLRFAQQQRTEASFMQPAVTSGSLLARVERLLQGRVEDPVPGRALLLGALLAVAAVAMGAVRLQSALPAVWPPAATGDYVESWYQSGRAYHVVWTESTQIDFGPSLDTVTRVSPGAYVRISELTPSGVRAIEIVSTNGVPKLRVLPVAAGSPADAWAEQLVWAASHNTVLGEPALVASVQGRGLTVALRALEEIGNEATLARLAVELSRAGGLRADELPTLFAATAARLTRDVPRAILVAGFGDGRLTRPDDVAALVDVLSSIRSNLVRTNLIARLDTSGWPPAQRQRIQLLAPRR